MSGSSTSAKPPSSACAPEPKRVNGSSDEGNDTASEGTAGRASVPPAMTITSDECNVLIYRYLQESGFVHSAFTFAYESLLGRSNNRIADKHIPPGALISFLQKGLQYVGIEESLQRDGPEISGKRAKGSNGAAFDPADFSLLSPQTIAALNRQNPPIQLNVPPATAAAAVKARLEAEAKLQAEAKAAAVAAATEQGMVDSIGNSMIPPQQSLEVQQPLSFGGQASLAVQAAAAHAAAATAMSQLQQSAAVASSGEFMSGSAGAAAFAAQQQRINQIMRQQDHDGMMMAQRGKHGDAHVAAVVLASVAERSDAPPSTKGASFKKSKKSQQGNGSGGPSSSSKASPVVALHLQQSGQVTHGFASLEEAVARLEAKNAASAARSTGPAPMEIDDNDKRALSTASPAVPPVDAVPVTSNETINGVNRLMEQNALTLDHSTTINGRGGSSLSMAAAVLAGVSRQQQQPSGLQLERAPESEEISIEEEDERTQALPSEVLELKKHASEVFMCAWNPVYTNLIATGSGDASARIWQMGGPDAKAGCGPVRLLPHGTDPNDRKNKDVTTLEWSSDGELLATGSYDGVARVWSRTGALVHTLRGHRGPIFSLKWNRSGNFLLSGSYDKTTIVWDVSKTIGSVMQQFNDHTAPALDVDWKDDTTFASCSTDKTVNICRVGVSHPLKTYTGHTDEVNAVKWDPSGTLLASCSDDCTAKIWDVASDRIDPLHDLRLHQQEIYTVKWSPTGAGSMNPYKQKMLATASFDGSVRLWNVQDGTCIRVFSRHRDSVYSVSFSPSGEYLASGSLAGQLYIWNVREGKHVKSFKGKGDIFEVAWNVEETRVAACFSSNVVSVIDFNPP